MSERSTATYWICCLTYYCRKFGKHIQKKQLDIPEYASSFVDYKALKKVAEASSSAFLIAALTLFPFSS